MVSGVLDAVSDSDVSPEHPAHANRLRGDHRCPTRQAFEYAAGKHRWRLGYGVNVQYRVIATVGCQHLSVCKCTLDRLSIPVWETIVSTSFRAV